MPSAFWITLSFSVLFAVIGFNSFSLPVRSISLDVSWPNCDAIPQYQYGYGIVGATGGLNFHKNPCIVSETSWFQGYALYMNTGYAGKAFGKKYRDSPRNCAVSDDYCVAFNWGYNAARFALDYAAINNVHSNTWWLDVETVNSWSDNGRINRQSLLGAITAIRHELFLPVIGFYAYPAQWDVLTSDWRNNFPAWAATGTADRNDALEACLANSFTGGPIVMAQFTESFDINVICSGFSPSGTPAI